MSHVLPVMMVKDPLTWMKSMCRHPYASRFKYNSKDCPLIDNDPVVVAWQVSGRTVQAVELR